MKSEDREREVLSTAIRLKPKGKESLTKVSILIEGRGLDGTSLSPPLTHSFLLSFPSCWVVG